MSGVGGLAVSESESIGFEVSGVHEWARDFRVSGFGLDVWGYMLCALTVCFSMGFRGEDHDSPGFKFSKIGFRIQFWCSEFRACAGWGHRM